MAKIIGNTTATPNPQPDWLQDDANKADYIKNKPMDYDAQMNAVSFGTNTHAGGKGFKVVGIVEENGTVVGYDLRTTDGLEVGQTYSVRLDSAAYNCGEITEISGNRIKVSNAPNIKALNTNDDNPENGFVGNVLTIKGRPDLGDIDIGFNAFAEGSGNYASEANAHAEGSNNYSLGKAAHTEGSGNIAGYGAHAEGSNNKALGDQSHAEGVNNTASGAASHTEGNGNEASGKRSHAGGYKTKATGEDAFAHGEYAVARGTNSVAFGYSVSASETNQAVFGQFNEIKEDPLFIVGNGTADKRSNAFEVHEDGHATVAKAGTGENDVATYGQIVPKITRPATDKAEYVYTRTPSGGIDLKRGTFHPDGNTFVSRDKDGRFKSAEPVDNADVANKKYVDESIANVQDEIDKIDLGDYAKVAYVDDKITEVNERIDGIDDGFNVVQNTGNSETSVMSQKAVTETLEGTSVSEILTFNEMEHTSGILSDKVVAHVQNISGGRAFVEVNDAENPTYYEFKKTTIDKLINTSKDGSSQSEVDFGSIEFGWNDVLDVESGKKTTSGTAIFEFPNIERVEEPVYETAWSLNKTYWDDDENMTCEFIYDPYSFNVGMLSAPDGCTHGMVNFEERGTYDIIVYKSLEDVPSGIALDYCYIVYYDDQPHDHYYLVFVTTEYGSVEEIDAAAGSFYILWLDGDDNDANVRSDTYQSRYPTDVYNTIYINPGWKIANQSVKVDWSAIGMNQSSLVTFSYPINDLPVLNDTNMLCNFIADKITYSATSTENKCTTNPFNTPMVYYVKDGDFVVAVPGSSTVDQFLKTLFTLQNNSQQHMRLYYETGETTTEDITLDGSFVYHNGGELKFVDGNGEVVAEELTVSLMQETSGYVKRVSSHSDKDRIYMVDKSGDNAVVSVDDVIDENNIARRDYVSDWFDWLNDYFGFTVGLEYVLTDDDSAYSVAGIGLADGAENVVILPKFKNKDVVEIGDVAFSNNTKVVEVSVPDTVTNIGRSAFEKCANLSELNIPSELKSIGDGAFNGCSKLFSDTNNLPDGLTDIGANAFAGTKIRELTIPYGVMAIHDGTFANCVELKTVNIPSTVTSVSETAFNGSPIVTATIPDCAALAMPRETLCDVTINDSEVQIRANAFKECSELNNVTIPDGVSKINHYAFAFCPKISNVNLPSALTYLGDSAFMQCNNLTLGDAGLPEGLTYIGPRAFYGTSIDSVKIPDGVQSVLVNTFAACSNLTTIEIGSNIKDVDHYAFSGCPIADATVPSHVISSIPKDHLSVVTINGGDGIPDNSFKECGSLTEVSFDSEITTIGVSAFENCDNVTNLSIPDTVTVIGDKAFSGCSNLEIDGTSLPSRLTSIGSGAFSGTKIGNEVKLPNSVVDIKDEAFAGCTGLTKVDIRSSTTTNISDSAFKNCPISEAIIPIWAAYAMPRDTLQKAILVNFGNAILADAFNGCTKLSSVNIPDGFTAIEENGFKNCSSLTAINLKDNIETIGENAFDGCVALDSVSVNNLSAWCNISFANSTANPLCYAKDLKVNDSTLTDITIPGGVATLNDYVFYNYDKLEKVTIGADVVGISELAFVGCDGLNEFAVSDDNSFYSVHDRNLYGRTGENNLMMIRYANAKEDKYFETLTGDNVKYMRIEKYAFDGAKNLRNVLIHDNVITVKSSAFRGCDNAKFFCVEDSQPITWADDWNPMNRPVYWGITFPDDTTNALEFTNNDEDMTTAIKCTDRTVEAVTIPTLMNGYAITQITDGAFNYCDNLTSVVIPNGVTSIGVQAFAGCSAMTRVTFGSDIKSIGRSAFFGCSSLKNVSIPNGVETIGEEAFSGCTGLETIIIPASVTTMGHTVFLDCSTVHIYCEAESKPDGWSAAWSSGSSGNITWGYTG